MPHAEAIILWAGRLCNDLDHTGEVRPPGIDPASRLCYFIPLLGYLDDLILVPLGIALALRMIPPEVMADSRSRADQMLSSDRPRSWVAAVVIVALWLALSALAVLLTLHAFRGR